MRLQPITAWLAAWSKGEGRAFDQLAPLVYAELRKLAASYLRRERGSHTLETGALVHEAVLRLVDQRQVSWQNRSHFYGIAALAMRRVLIEHARSRLYARRGHGALHLPLEAADGASDPRAETHPAIAEALQELADRHPQVARVVELRFFGGYSEGEIASALGLSVPTIKRRWRMARAWLFAYLSGAEPHDP